MRYLGDINPGNIIDGTFNTRDATGAPFTLAGTPAIRVYKGSSTTESASTGITLTVDFDSRTGMHYWAVDTSQDGSFYTAAENYRVVLTAGTVNSISVAGTVIAEFSIQNRNHLRPTTAGRTLDVSAGGEAGIDWANVGSPTTTLALSGTTIDAAGLRSAVGMATANLDTQLATIDDFLDTEVAAIKAKTDNLPSDPADASDIAAAFGTVNATLGTIAGFIDTEVAAIKAKTDNLPASPAAVGSPMTLADDAITAAKIATGAIDADALATDAVNEIAAGILDLANGVETGLTFRQAMRLLAAAEAGKLSGAATTTIVIRNAVADSKDRITATVTANGDRTGVAYDLT